MSASPIGAFVSVAATTIDSDLRVYMVEKARFRDRLYFVSDGNAAAELGVSRHTIIRAKKRLEAKGEIVRIGRRKISKCKATVVYGFPKGELRLSPNHPAVIKAKHREAVLLERRRKRTTNRSGGQQWYAKYRRSEHWQSFRVEYQHSMPWECVVCGKTERLHLHHLTYERIWSETFEDVVPLCGGHHMRAHKRMASGVDMAVAHLK